MKNFDEERLREEYSPKKRTGLDDAKALDTKCKLPCYILAYTLGIIGALVLGLGMCLAMGVLGSGPLYMAIGIVIGVIGIAVVCANHPIFLAYLKRRKEKFASAILVALNSNAE